MKIFPFKAVRPHIDVAHDVAALPYDVYDRAEAAAAVEGKPLSFLNIDRPETQFDPSQDMYAPEVYAKAKEMLQSGIAEGVYERESDPRLYIYELVMNGRSQKGIVATCDIDDYEQGLIKKHEDTLPKKEQDRINHISALDAQTGPIFLAYRDEVSVDNLVEEISAEMPLYNFVADDGITHRVWRASEDQTKALAEAFGQVPAAYIADGHHRAASAVKVGLQRRKQNPDFDGSEEFNHFLAVLFPKSQLKILAYNRVVFDLNGNTVDEFLEKVSQVFDVEHIQESVLEPAEKGAVAMYLDGKWYGLGFKEEFLSNHPVDGLDVAILQNQVLSNILGIDDPRTSDRIVFVGGIRPTEELAQKVDALNAPGVAFAMYPTSIDELLSVADAGLRMPPKSTWFEPKL
ncbi:MAG: DUF1015 domain-containing protein, partial [Eggerthellaceae bacterium]|nr:DUF1015 domain-containing protein [Eggerthellaceae bacterium]